MAPARPPRLQLRPAHDCAYGLIAGAARKEEINGLMWQIRRETIATARSRRADRPSRRLLVRLFARSLARRIPLELALELKGRTGVRADRARTSRREQRNCILYRCA